MAKIMSFRHVINTKMITEIAYVLFFKFGFQNPSRILDIEHVPVQTNPTLQGLSSHIQPRSRGCCATLLLEV